MSEQRDEGQIEKHAGLTDERMDQIIGNLLRIGVIVSALVVLGGGILYLTREGQQRTPDLHDFHSQPEEFRSPTGILHKCAALSGRGLVMLGLLLLIATPVARVIFSTAAFLLQRDYLYVLFTLVVLGVLLYSLFSGYFWDSGA
jgi:uncharacterized membrane protein